MATRSFASPWILALTLGGGPVSAQSVESMNTRVQAAIEEAVQQRLGPAATVTAEIVDIHVTDTADAVVAWPEQGVRAGAAGRFLLFSSDSRRVRVGEAIAVVSVTVDAVQLKRAIAPGQVIASGDVEHARTAFTGPLVPLPRADEVVGGRARRDLATGATLTKSDVAPEPAIRSGESVRAVVRTAGVEASATAIALQSGSRSEVIRLTNPASRKALLGRVTGPGEVEVVEAY